jgi:hypothetical protein
VCQQDEGEQTHDHKAFSIIKEVREQQGVWDAMKDELSSLLAAATKVQEPHQSLIDMCERLMISAPKNNFT